MDWPGEDVATLPSETAQDQWPGEDMPAPPAMLLNPDLPVPGPLRRVLPVFPQGVGPELMQQQPVPQGEPPLDLPGEDVAQGPDQLTPQQQAAREYAKTPQAQAELAVPSEAPYEVKAMVQSGYSPEQAWTIFHGRPTPATTPTPSVLDEATSAIRDVVGPLEPWTQTPFPIERPFPELPAWQEQPTLGGKLSAGMGQVLGGALNLPSDIWNFLTTPAGVAMGGAAEMGPVISRAVAAGFTVDQIRQGLQSDNLQEQVELALGAGLGAAGVIHPKPFIAPAETRAGALEPLALTPADRAEGRPMPRDVFDELTKEKPVAREPVPEELQPKVAPPPEVAPAAVTPIEVPPTEEAPEAPPLATELLPTTGARRVGPGWQEVIDQAKQKMRDAINADYPSPRARTNAIEATRNKVQELQAQAHSGKPYVAPETEQVPPTAPPKPVVEAKPEVQAQVEKVIRETKAQPDTAPQKMRVQKAYLLDALDTAHKSAPDTAVAPIGDAERAALQASNPYRRGYTTDYNASTEERAAQEAARDATQRAEVQPLIDKYGLGDFRYREPGYFDYSMGERPQWREPVDRPATHDELIKELANRIDEARAKELPKITIDVPGDGTFEIVNTKDAIAQFRNEARKRFPTTLARAKEPTTGGRVTPEAIPPVAKGARTREDLIKIAGRAASTDEVKYVLHQVVASTGNELVATDGRRLIMIDYKGPTAKETIKGKGKAKAKEVTKPALFDVDTQKLTKDKAKAEGNYPNWKQVVPTDTHKKYATVDTGNLMKLITQAEQVIGERSHSVKLWMDDKGKLGITASGPEIGEFAGGDANPNTAKVLGAYSPEFLKDGLRIARQLGHEKVDLWLDKKTTEMSPAVLKAKGMQYVLMPMRISDSGNLADIATRPVGEHPMAEVTPEIARERGRADVFNELRRMRPGDAIAEMEKRGIPTDAVEAHAQTEIARGAFGRRGVTTEEFETALRSDLDKWNPEPTPPEATKAGAPAPVVAGVSPALTVFQGTGRADKTAIYSPSTGEPVLGKGNYYAFDPDVAKKYGPDVKEHTITPQNPLVIQSDQEWSNFARSIGVSPKWWQTRPEDVKPATRRAISQITAYLKAQGHDAVVIRGTDKPENDTLRSVFSRDQVFVPEGKAPRAAGGSVGSPLEAPSTSTSEVLGKPIAPAPPPTLPPGQTMIMGKLPVTMARTRPGEISPGRVIDSLRDLSMAIGGTGEIHKGRFNMRRYAGVYKPFSETIRLNQIDNIPTAVHEIGHDIAKQFYGSTKSRGLGGYPPAVKRELVALGKALYGSTRPNAGYTAEGLSEFMRLYLTTDDGARQSAPATLDFFENKVLKDHPEIVAPLERSKRLIDTYRFQGSEARMSAQMQREPGWTRRVLDALGHFFSPQGQVESGLPLKRLSEEAAFRLAKGQPGKAVPIRPLPPSADPYKLFKMKRGSSGPILETMVEDHMVNIKGEPTGPSLREAFAEIPKRDEKKFSLYLFGKIAEKRWAEGKNPGISREDAAYIRSTTETPEFQRAADKYLQWMHGVLDYLGESDAVARPLVDKLKQESFYAPLARLLDSRMARTQAARAQSNSLYRMHGSGLPVKNIIEQSLRSAERIITYANRRLVANSIIKLARIPGMGKMIEEVPRAVAHQQVNFENIRDGLENMGVDTTNVPDDTILEYYTPADRPKGSDPIIPWKAADGSTHWYRVHPKLYDTLDKLEPWSLRNLHPQLGPILDLFYGGPKRMFTLGTTGLRPTFSMVTNPIRDPMGWLLQTKAGVNPPKMAAAYASAMREVVTGLATGQHGPYEQLARNLGTAMAQPIGRDVRYTRHAAKGLFEQGRVMRIVRNPIDHLRQLLGAPESVPRIAEMMRIADQIGWKPGDPISMDQAVEMALGYKEATVDFSAAGDVSRIINEAVPFYNPNIQGMRTAYRALRDNPLRTVLWGLAAFTGPALYLWWKNKDQFWYRNLPYRERYYYTHIDDGKHVWQLPRPFEWSNLFQVIPEAAFDSWYERDPRAATEALQHIFQTQMPVQGIEDVGGVLGRVAKEQWSNNVSFWDHPIVPRSEQDLPPQSQVGPYTSKAAEWIGKALATIPGLPQETQSPRRIDAAMRSFFGGTVPDLLDAVGLGSVKKDRESEFADIPVIGKLARRGGYFSPQSQYLSDFWDINQRLQAKQQAVSMQMNDPTRVQAVPMDDPDLLFASMFSASAKNITFVTRMANQMKESKARSAIYEEVAHEAKDLVDTYNEAQKNIQ